MIYGCEQKQIKDNISPDRVAQSLEHQKAAGSIQGQGTYLGCRFDPQSGQVWEATNFSLSHRCFSLSLSPSSLPLPLKSINISLGEN